MALGLRMPSSLGSVGKGSVLDSPESQRLQQEWQQQQEQSIQNIQGAQARTDKAVGEAEQAAKGMGDITGQYVNALKPVPEFNPRVIDQQEMFNFAGIAIGLAALATKAVKGDVTLMMTAAGSAIKGYNEGNYAQAQLDLKQFQEKMASVQAANQSLTDKYKAIMEDRKLTLNQKLQMVNVEAHRTSDTIAIEAIKTGNLKTLLDRNDALTRGGRELELQNRQFDLLRRSIDIQTHLAQLRSTGGGKPVFVKKPDGTLTQVIPQFDESGKMSNIPEGWKVMGTHAGPETRGGALNARYAFNITESFAQSAIDLTNVAAMPSGTTLGLFAGMTGQSGDTMVRSLSTAFARGMTDQDTRMMQQVVSGLEMNMARALGGGYAQSSAAHMIEAYKQQLPKVGDSPANTAMFLARVKQELGVLSKAFKGHPGATEEWVGQMNDYMDSINHAIPFNVPQVLSAARDGRETISDSLKALATEPFVTTIPSERSGGDDLTYKGFRFPSKEKLDAFKAAGG